AAISTLGVEMVAPNTGFPSRSATRIGFSQVATVFSSAILISSSARLRKPEIHVRFRRGLVRGSKRDSARHLQLLPRVYQIRAVSAGQASRYSHVFPPFHWRRGGSCCAAPPRNRPHVSDV